MQRDTEAAESVRSELVRTLSDPAFLASLCHDLRGPLGAIGAWLHVLGSGRADAATQQQAIAAMQRDIAAQSQLVEQLADLSSILGGTLVLSIEEVDLGSLLEELGAELVANPPPSPRVIADAKRLRQILAILLTVPGGVELDGGSRVVTAEHEGPHAFSIRGLARPGSPGLVGVTLARALAELQGAHLSVSPAADGTAFAIQLRVGEPG